MFPVMHKGRDRVQILKLMTVVTCNVSQHQGKSRTEKENKQKTSEETHQNMIQSKNETRVSDWILKFELFCLKQKQQQTKK